MSRGRRRRSYRKLTTAGIACLAILLAGLALRLADDEPRQSAGIQQRTDHCAAVDVITASTNIAYALGNVTAHANGTLDLVMICGENIIVVPGNGDGTFTSASVQSTPLTNFFGPAAQISLVDVDGDGNLDLITTDDNCSVDVFLGTGSGTFSATPQKITEPIYMRHCF